MTSNPDTQEPDSRTPLQRMADLTRRVIAVGKSEVVKAKPKKRKAK